MKAKILFDTARHRRRRAAAVAVLSVALGSVLLMPYQRPAPATGAAYAAIAARPATPDAVAPAGAAHALRLAGFAHAIVPGTRAFPQAAIDYTPGAAGMTSTGAALPPLALDGAPAAGAYFPAGARAGDIVRGSLPGGGFATGGVGGGAPGGAGTPGGTVTTPPDGTSTPEGPVTPAPTTGDPTSGTTVTTPTIVDPAPGTTGTIPATDGGTVPPPPGPPTTDGGGDVGQGVIPGPPSPQTPINGIGGVPEPATWALLLLGFGAIGAAQRRRLRARAVA